MQRLTSYQAVSLDFSINLLFARSQKNTFVAKWSNKSTDKRTAQKVPNVKACEIYLVKMKQVKTFYVFY